MKNFGICKFLFPFFSVELKNEERQTGDMEKVKYFKMKAKRIDNANVTG